MTSFDAASHGPRDGLPAWIAERLTRPLSPEAARARFAPALSYGRHFGPPAADAREAAVMVLLYPRDGAWHVPFTIRPETMAAHAGQISFPGGVVEAGETTRDAALRELGEELGVDPRTVVVLGSLSPVYVFASNFLVTPWVAVAREPLTFQPSTREVAEVIEVSLAHLLDPANFSSHTIRRGAMEFTAPHFAWREHRIWGATCIILGELIVMLGEIPAALKRMN